MCVLSVRFVRFSSFFKGWPGRGRGFLVLLFFELAKNQDNIVKL